MMRTRTLTALAATGALLLAAMAPALASRRPPDGMGGGGSGGHDSGAGNNLSFPVLWSEAGSKLTLRDPLGAPVIEGTVTNGTNTNSPDDQTPCLGAVQKDANNTWQADNAEAPENAVAIVDWGDKLEARDVGEHAAGHPGGDQPVCSRRPYDDAVRDVLHRR